VAVRHLLKVVDEHEIDCPAADRAHDRHSLGYDLFGNGDSEPLRGYGNETG
jgi:hypothetical protein